MNTFFTMLPPMPTQTNTSLGTVVSCTPGLFFCARQLRTSGLEQSSSRTPTYPSISLSLRVIEYQKIVRCRRQGGVIVEIGLIAVCPDASVRDMGFNLIWKIIIAARSMIIQPIIVGMTVIKEIADKYDTILSSTSTASRSE